MASVACVRVRQGHGERCPGVLAHEVVMATRRRLVWCSRGKAMRAVARVGCACVGYGAHRCTVMHPRRGLGGRVHVSRLAWPFGQGGCARVCSVTVTSRRGCSHGAMAAAQNKARDRMAAYQVRSRATTRRGGMSKQRAGEAVPC